MLSNTEMIKAYEAFLAQFDKDTSWKKDLLDIDMYKLKNLRGAEPRWFLFHMHSLDFVREIVFSLNRFRYYVARLSSWCEIIPSYSNKDKLDLLIDFIYPVALISIDYPYKLKNRVIYSACYLCHFSNHLLKIKPTRRLPEDKSINYKVFKSIGIGWTHFNELNNALAAMNNIPYRKQTEDFRNSEHHAIPPAIEMGHSRLVRRVSCEKGKQTYALGGQQPLPLKVLVSLLKEEHLHGAQTFRALSLLMEEQRMLFKCT